MATAAFDANSRTTIIGVDSSTFLTPTTVAVDPTTHEMLVKTDALVNQDANITQINSHAVIEAGVNGTLAVGGNQVAGSAISTNVDPVLVAGSDYGGTPALRSMKVDSSGKLYASTVDTVTAVTAITNALPTGSNVIGHVIADTGSTTAVTQATGTNLHMVVDSGTVTTVSAVTAITNALPTGTNSIGNVGASTATGTTVPANALYHGVQVITALPTAASNGNLVGVSAEKYGRIVMVPQTIRDLVGTQTTTISASTAETTIVTQASSVFNDLMVLVVSNTSAATNTRIDFRDTTGGSILFSLQSVGGGPPIGFALGGAAIPQTSVNTNWTAQCATSTTDIRIYAVFAKNK